MAHVYNPHDIFSYIETLRMSSAAAFDLFKAFQEEFVVPDTEEMEESLSVSMYYNFPATVSNIHEFKGNLQLNFILDRYEQVAEVLRRCRALTKSALVPEESNNNGQSKTLCFSNEDVTIYIAFSGTKCRYVEVGKKEVPVYELQCDE